MCLNNWNQAFHFNTRTINDFGLVFVVVVLIVIPPQIVCLKHVF